MTSQKEYYCPCRERDVDVMPLDVPNKAQHTGFAFAGHTGLSRLMAWDRKQDDKHKFYFNTKT